MIRPRIGFLGTGWIGRNRLEGLAAAGIADPVMFCDPDDHQAEALIAAMPAIRRAPTFETMLDAGVEGVVIATPSALHATQARAALAAGCAVFCQKPLGRDASEVETVIAAAREADRLLGLDLSYRHCVASRAVRDLVRGGALGRVHAVDLVFHNAYGPDKDWFRDPRLSGGGCVIDLGVHLVDLAGWVLGPRRVEAVSSHLMAGGKLLPPDPKEVEDFALATILLVDGCVVRLACSWNLHAGMDAMIEAVFHGEVGDAVFRNVGGSFYDFAAEWRRGTSREVLARPPDAWGGRAIVDWARRLAQGARFDAEALCFLEVARVLDQIYGRL